MPQTGVFRDRWWRQAIRAYQTGRTRTNPKDQVSPTTGDLGVAVALAPDGLVVAIATAAPGIQAALAPVSPPADTAATILDYATLGQVKGATGGSTQNHLIYAQNTGRWWFFTYAGSLNSGTATGAGQSTSQLVDTSKTFTASTYRGATCLILTGTGAGQAFEIGANTTTALTVQNNGVGGTIQTAPVAGSSTYVILETRRIKAYVSSSNDLSTATWALATNGTSAAVQNQTGIDVSGGRNDSGGFGEFPTDARLFAMGYASIASTDVVMALAQQNLHWMKISLRGKLGPVSAGTMAWDSPGATNTNPWDDGFPGNECAPTMLQGLAVGASTTNRWHALHHQNTVGIVGYPQDANDTGTGDTSSESLDWAGTRATYDSTSNANPPWQSALAQLASGVMLGVHAASNSVATFGAGVCTQNGLRWVASTSATAWPTTSTAAAISGLSSTANSPNDWGMVGVSTTDVHVVRRNSGTVLEHVRFNGTAWGSVATLPTTGLTGHVANSGVGMATDGTTVWCVVLDSDANSSIKYLTWTSAGGWASSWTTAATNANAKAFVAVHAKTGNSQVGVAWTEGPDGSGRYSVRAAPIATSVTQSATSAPGIQAALAPAGLALAQASATLGVAAALAPSGIGVTTGTATPGIQAALAPTGLDLAQASSIPGITAALAPAGIGVAPATAAPGITAALAPAALDIAPATSAPAIVAALAPSGLDIAPATSTPGVQVGLAPSSTATAIVTATPGVQAALAPSALAVGVATATPGVAVGLAPSAGGASGSATPGITATLAPSALAVALATAAPAVTVALAPAAIGIGSTTTAPGVTAALAPSGLGVAIATAAPAVAVGLAPQAFAQTTAASTPGVTVALFGSAGGLQIATSAPGVVVALAGVAVVARPGSGSPGVTVALVAAALVVAPVQAAPGLLVALVSVAFVVGRAQATPGVTVALVVALAPVGFVGPDADLTMTRRAGAALFMVRRARATLSMSGR